MCPRSLWGEARMGGKAPRRGKSLHPCHYRGRVERGLCPRKLSGGGSEGGQSPPPRERESGMQFVTRVREFFKEVLAEFRRVNWPSRQELANSTVVVLVVTLVVAFFLGLVDIGLARVVERILR